MNDLLVRLMLVTAFMCSSIWSSSTDFHDNHHQRRNIAMRSMYPLFGRDVETEKLSNGAHEVDLKVERIRRKRYSDFTEVDYHLIVTMVFENKRFRLHLKKYSFVMSADFELVIRNGNETLRVTNASSLPLPECLYQGIVNDEEGSSAALADCDGRGMTGIVIVGTKHYIIQPLKHKFNETKSTLHLMYEKSKETICGNTGRNDMIAPELPASVYNVSNEGDADYDDNTNRIRRAENKLKTIEMAAFVDDVMYENVLSDFPKNPAEAIYNIVFTMLNAVQLLYNQPSGLPVDFKIILVKIEILETARAGPSKGNGEIKEYLKRFCRWQADINPDDDLQNPKHWDHAIMLSGLNLYQETPDQHKVIGLAWVSGMCRRTYSCSVNEGNNFESVYVITHEMGHNLGMAHDGEGNNCNSTTHIMSPSLGPGKIKWSTCSRDSLSDFLSVSTSECLNDAASPAPSFDHERNGLLPGEHFPSSEQCSHAFGDMFRPYAARKQPFDNICRELWCAKGSQARRAHPALDGTTCGYGKICSYGECVIDDRDQSDRVKTRAMEEAQVDPPSILKEISDVVSKFNPWSK